MRDEFVFLGNPPPQASAGKGSLAIFFNDTLALLASGFIFFSPFNSIKTWKH
ncbi:MAG: hypothetical protein IPM82_27080 [Saprospiraceae bacterium]|nr:hypothetical protein [Saprospiraceae bacterium]